MITRAITLLIALACLVAGAGAADTNGIKVTEMAEITTFDSNTIFYLVIPALGTNGSKKAKAAVVLEAFKGFINFANLSILNITNRGVFTNWGVAGFGSSVYVAGGFSAAGVGQFGDTLTIAGGGLQSTIVTMTGGQAVEQLLKLQAGTTNIVPSGLIIANAFAGLSVGQGLVWDGSHWTNGAVGGSGEINVNGEASVTNGLRYGWVFGKAGVSNLLRSVEAMYGLTITNQGTNLQFAVLPIFQLGSAWGTNIAGTGAITNLNLGGTIYVATNGNNATGLRARPDKPFLNCSNALAASKPGDTIYVLPGVYNERCLFSNNVNWYWMDGASLTNWSTVGGWGLFDDRLTGPVTCSIDGNGEFAWGLDAATIPAQATNGAGAFVITNALSRVTVRGKRGWILAPGINASGGMSFISSREGTNRFIFDSIIDPNWQDQTGLGGGTEGGNGIFWQKGDLFTSVRYMKVEGYCIWAEKPANTWFTNGNEAFLDADWLISDIFPVLYHDGASTNANWKTWIRAKNIQSENAVGSGTIAAYGGGKVYVDAERIAALGSTDYALRAAVGPVQLWVTAQKVSSAVTWFRNDQSNAQAWLRVLHWEDLGGVVDGFRIDGGTNWIDGGYASCAKIGINHSGGNGIFSGTIIDTSAGTSITNLPVLVRSNGLTLRNVTLVAPAVASNAISAFSAFTVDVDGYLKANTNRNANVTLRGGWFSPSQQTTLQLPGATGANGTIMTNNGAASLGWWDVVAAILNASTNAYRFVGGTGGVTTSSSSGGGLTTVTINDDDAGSGGAERPWVWQGQNTNQVLSWAKTNIIIVAPSNTVTFSFANLPPAGSPSTNLTLWVYLTSSFSGSLIFPGGVDWRGIAPVAVIGMTNVYDFAWTGTNIVGFSSQDYTTGSGQTVALQISPTFSNTVTVAGITGTGPPRLRLLHTNGTSYTEFTTPAEWKPTNSYVIAGTNLQPGDVFKVLSSSIASGVATVIITNVGLPYRNIYVDAAAMASNTTGGAFFQTEETSSPTNRMVDSYVHSGSDSNIVQFKVAMPLQWDLGTVKVKLWTWSTNNIATTTNIWEVAASAIKSTSTISNVAWGTALEITNVVSSAGGQALLTPATPALTVGNSPAAAGNLVWFRIRRLPQRVDDNDGGQQKLLGAWIQYRESATEAPPW